MKSIKIYFVFLIIALLLLPLNVLATMPPDSSIDSSLNTGTTGTQIVSFNTDSVNINTEFYLILNLTNVSYSKFKVEISNSANLTANTVTSAVSELKSSSNITSFIVDKSLINLDKLGIVYTSPAQETNIAFTVKITNLENTIEELEKQVESLKSDIADLQSKLTDKQKELENLSPDLDSESEEYKTISNSIQELKESIENKTTEVNSLQDKITNFTAESFEESATITVRKDAISDEDTSSGENDKENEKNPDKPFGDKDGLLEEVDKDKEMSTSMKDMIAQMSKLQSNLDEANNTISSLTKNVTYQGSQNNYLKSLNISGIEFKNNFKKTTLNYFAEVDKDTSSVTVNAVAEDSSAIVTIYGNTNLREGKNKVLITITADDGSIRTYKIYITK